MTSNTTTSNPFDQDVRDRGGYLYTDTQKLSARVANRRISEALWDMVDLRDKRVLDVCCGDGAYSLEWFEHASPKEMIGLDLAAEAVKVANERATAHQPRLRFQVGDACHLSGFANDSFDVAVYRGALHHLPDPAAAVAEGARVARQVVILEPNGHSPGLKLLEKISPYHRSHGEQSFSHRLLRTWVQDAGLQVQRLELLGFVPMFASDPLVGLLKAMEPVVEHTPLLNHLLCAQVCLLAGR